VLHDEGNRYPDTEGSADTLYHDEGGPLYAVVIADKAEQEAGQQAVDSVGFKIVPGV